MEMRKLICFANWLAGFRMVSDFAERYFCAEYVVIALSICRFLNLSAMIVVALSKSLAYYYYVVCN